MMSQIITTRARNFGAPIAGRMKRRLGVAGAIAALGDATLPLSPAEYGRLLVDETAKWPRSLERATSRHSVPQAFSVAAMHNRSRLGVILYKSLGVENRLMSATPRKLTPDAKSEPGGAPRRGGNGLTEHLNARRHGDRHCRSKACR
jgi:hypothetical protein